MKNKPSRCGNCGSPKIELIEVDGPFPWRDFPAVYLVEPLKMLVCRECGERISRYHQRGEIDEAIHSTLKRRVVHYIDEVITREGCLQAELAKRLGATPEYLSEIKSGRKIPSFSFYTLLKLFAKVPGSFRLSDPREETREELSVLGQ